MTTYFITICAHMQQNLFQQDQVAELMVSTFFRYRDTGEFELHEYVVMPNHVHLLLSQRGKQQLGRVIQLIKGGFSYSLRTKGIIFNAVWQQRYYARRVRDMREFAAFSQYIRQNPARRKLAAIAEDYPYSSAGQRTRVPGLKPLNFNEGNGDANLKARSTLNEDEWYANLKVRSTVRGLKPLTINACVSDASLKARSTGPGLKPLNVN